MIKAFIFDKDGILQDSVKANVEAAVEAFKAIGIIIKEEEKNQIIGKHPADYLAYFKKHYRFDSKQFNTQQRKFYKKILKDCLLFKDTIRLVKDLKEAGYKVALTTSSQKKYVEAFIEKAELKNTFDATITFDDITRRKPDPQPYLATAEKLNIPPKECVVIEDSATGLKAAKNANMACIIIPNTYTKHQDFSKADIILSFPDEIKIDIVIKKLKHFRKL